jgi:nitric oxide synthase-interacting protein
VDPVATPFGYVYSREAILENLLAQKKANKRKMVEWERYVEKQKREREEEAATEQIASVLAFERKMMGSSDDVVRTIAAAVGEKDKNTVSSVMNIKENESRMKGMKAFWVPGKGDGVEEQVTKPDMKTSCPASGKPLKLKDLISLRLTPARGGKSHEYIDPVSGDSLTNASRLVVLKPTGDVMLLETYTKVIKSDGEYNGKRIDDDDVVELVCGGTGFAAHDKDGLQARKYFALGTGQYRGQTAAGGNTTNSLRFTH